MTMPWQDDMGDIDGGSLPLSAADSALAKLVSRSQCSPGRDTAAIVGRLAAQQPELPPSPPPTVPGLTDLIEVGRGGMGVVYRARETRLDRVVAVKVLATGAGLAPEGRSRAEREATLLTRVVHPNVVQVFYVADVDGAPAIVMEWIDGPSLDQRVAAGVLPAAEAATLVADVGRAVAVLHARGIVHRDLKPANVLLARSGDGASPTPKLVDFGLACLGSDLGSAVTRDGIACGTPSFMAPEQTGFDPALGQVGPATDIHALGGILYWLLSGTAPFDAESTAESVKRAALGKVRPLEEIVVGVPVDLKTIVGKCLAPRPEDRYASAAALVEDLDRFRDGRPILARAVGPVERLGKWARRRPALATLGVTTVVAALALLGGTVYHVLQLEVVTTALAASRRRSVDTQDQVRRAFQRLTDDTGERFLTRGAPLQESDRDHLRRIRDAWRGWPLEPDPATAWRFKASGLARVADLFHRLQWLPDALETARGAIECVEGIASHDALTAADEKLRERLRDLEIELLVRTGRSDEAATMARDDVSRLVRRVAAGDASAERRLAVAWAFLANTEAAAGHHVESLALHGKAVDLVDRLLAAAPNDVDLVCLSLPILYNAAISPALSDMAVRRARLERLIAVAGGGLEWFPEQHDTLGRGMLFGLTGLADLDLVAGNPADALEVVSRRAAVARAMLYEMPTSEQFLGEVVGAACQASACLMALGRPNDAEADLEEAVALASRAVAEQPAIAGRTRVLVEALVARAVLQQATGRHDDSVSSWQRVMTVLAPWIGGAELPRETPSDFVSFAERARGMLATLGVNSATALDVPHVARPRSLAPGGGQGVDRDHEIGTVAPLAR